MRSRFPGAGKTASRQPLHRGEGRAQKPRQAAIQPRSRGQCGDQERQGRALCAIKGRLGQVALQQDQTAYGRIFFELPDKTKISSFRFRPFGTKGKLAILPLAHGNSQQAAVVSPKPLPDGGTRKVAKRGRTTLKAVVYGSTGSINPDQFPIKPRSGHHIVAIKFGLRNMQGGLYHANPATAAFITSDKGKVSRALPSLGRGIGKIALKQNQGVNGRIFFEIEDKTTPRSFRFRPFGVADKPLVFAIKHGKGGGHTIGVKLPTETKLGTQAPLPGGGDRRVVTHNGTTVKTALYGGEGDVPDTKFAVKPPKGSHLIALDIGLRNMGPGSTRARPTWSHRSSTTRASCRTRSTRSTASKRSSSSLAEGSTGGCSSRSRTTRSRAPCG